MSDNYTLVYLAWRKKRRNHRLIFGDPCRHVRLDWQRSLAAFKPGDLFAYERWEANKFGTQLWSISVLQAGVNGEQMIKHPGIKPGAHLLAKRHGADACKAFFTVFDILRRHGDLNSLGRNDWRIIGHRLSAGAKPRNVLKDLSLVQ